MKLNISMLLLATALFCVPVSGQVRAKKNVANTNAVETLRALLTKQPDSVLRFDDVVRHARALNDADVKVLAETVGLQRNDGYRPWIRSAVYAEWGRRDFAAAFTFFKRQRNQKSRQQVLYALFLGSRPKDPQAAHAYLGSLLSGDRYQLQCALHPTNQWVQHAYRRIFAEWAAKDPEWAWTLLPGRAMKDAGPMNHWNLMYANAAYPDMVEGFFAGLKGRDMFALYVKRWGKDSTPERIAIRIVKQWISIDPVTALEQGKRFEPKPVPGAAQLIYGVAGNAVIRWANENSEAGLKALRNNTFPDWNHVLPRAIFRFEETAMFPEPGRANLLPDDAARYKSLVRAVRKTMFTSEQEQVLLRRLKELYEKLNHHLAD